ncbi:MAG: transporter [Gammaproteobacteria bacterium]|nr:MAG: transporter [Gammaproteobacteria bacterium]
MTIVQKLVNFMASALACMWVFGVAIILFGGPLNASLEDDRTSANDPLLSVRGAVDVALFNNPSLAQMQARYRALAEIPAQLGTLPDPVLSVNALNFPTDTFHVGQEGMTQMQLGISQLFPFPGKLALRERASELDAQAAGHSVEESRIRLISNVRSGWWQLYYLDRALAVVDRNQTLLRGFVQVARTKYEVADGLQQDVLLAQLELSKLIDQKIQLLAVRRNQASQLNVLMDVLPNALVRLPKTVNESLPTLVSEAELYQRAATHRPLLQQMASQIESAQSRLSLAEKEYYPDFKLGLAYGQRRGDMPSGDSRADLLSLMFSVNLPLHTVRRQSSAVRQRSHDLSENRYALEDQYGQVRAEISAAVTDYQRATQQMSLFKGGIIPQAQQTIASMQAGYQVNEVDFLNLIRSQVTLFTYQLRYWQALSEANQALARLMAAAGEENIYE